MFVPRLLTRLGLLVALVAPVPFVAACGGSTPEAKSVPKPADMPEGAEWSGVYFSPTYGHLHMVKEGSAISGKWRNSSGEKWVLSTVSHRKPAPLRVKKRPSA
jgi:hypothetical protein